MKKREVYLLPSICFFLVLLFVFVLGSVFWNNSSLITWGMVVLVSFIFVYYIYVNKEKQKVCGVDYVYWFIAFLLGIGFFQANMIEKLRFIPSFDLDAIYGGAIQWVKTGSFLDYYDYFDWFPNNLGGLCFFYLLFKIGSFFTTDYFKLAACANEVLILLTIAVISLSARKIWGDVQGVLALIMSSCMFPFLFMADAFYTDSLSILFPILLFYLSLCIDERTGKKAWKLHILFSFIASVGIFIKPTVGIIAVAICLLQLFKGRWGTAIKYIVTVGIIYMILVNVFHTYIYNNHLDVESANRKNTPYYHWIMMGLEGDGGYNPWDYEFTRSFTDPETRDVALKNEIGKRISEKGIFGMVKLYSSKMFRCFGDGTLGLSDFLDDNPQNESYFHKYILYEGKQYALYQKICNLIWYSFLFLALCFMIKNIRNGTDSGIILGLTIGGIVFFLMHWETSPRYITNYVPIIIISAIGGAGSLADMVRKLKFVHKITCVLQKNSCEVKIFAGAVGFRIVVYFLSVCIMAILGDYANGITFSDFLESWKRWDSAHYINIAENGYAGAIENGQHIFLVFYPLYPWLMKIMSLFLKDIRLCGILISVISYGIGCVFFYKITKKEFGKKEAENALVLISIFPFAFFFGSIATESLFFAIATSFFYYLRKHRWNKVAFLGFLACLTKVQGLLLAFAVLAELLYFKRGIKLIKERKWKNFVCRIIYPGCVAAEMLLGFLVYLVINYVVEGDAFRFMYYQKNHWGNGLCFMGKTINYITQYVVNGWYTSTGMSLWVPEMILFSLYLIAIVYGVCKRIRPMYLTYLVVFFLLTYSSTWLISAGRYTLSALPAFMLAGKGMAECEKIRVPVMILSAMIFTIYMIGYYSWKQIM